MDKALSIINEMPSTLSQVKSFVHMVKNEVLSGEINKLQFLAQLKAIEVCIDSLRTDKDIDRAIVDEFDREGINILDTQFASFKKGEFGTRYNYDNCNDQKLKELNQKYKMIGEELKARENWLKSLKEESYLDDTGEVIYPPSKTSTTKISVTLK
jgi:hypothetical protein